MGGAGAERRLVVRSGTRAAARAPRRARRGHRVARLARARAARPRAGARRLRADFTSSVSHELRTPLAQILLFAETLRWGACAPTASGASPARSIVREARRLMHLVENVLHFARGRAAATTARRRAGAAGAAGARGRRGFAPLAGARRASGSRRSRRTALAARGTRGALRQVLLNLLDNAVKYGPPGQTVARRLVALAGDRVRIWVDDQGPGMPRATASASGSRSCGSTRDARRVTPAAGSGSRVVRELVALHGGRAWVEDAPGGGARFVASFRRSRAAAATDADADRTGGPRTAATRATAEPAR